MDGEYILGPNGELYHHGTKGMRWGIRRYQNKDGSLTPAGRKRYAAENEKLKAREKAIKGREKAAARQAKLDAKKAELDAREAALANSKKNADTTKANASRPKSVKDMSDDEIRAAIARKELEDSYNKAHPQPAPKEPFMKKFIDEAAKPALIKAGKDFMEKALAKVTDKILEDKIDPNSLKGIEAANKKLRAQIENKLLKEGIDPNIKSENLKGWRNFNKEGANTKNTGTNDKTGSAKDAGKNDKTGSAKDAGKNDKTGSANGTKDKTGSGKNAKKSPKNDANRVYEGEVVGEGKSRRKTDKNSKKKTAPDIIDMEVSNLPAVYTTYGRDYLTNVLDWDDS